MHARQAAQPEQCHDARQVLHVASQLAAPSEAELADLLGGGGRQGHEQPEDRAPTGRLGQQTAHQRTRGIAEPGDAVRQSDCLTGLFRWESVGQCTDRDRKDEGGADSLQGSEPDDHSGSGGQRAADRGDAEGAGDKVATVAFPESADAVNTYPIAVLKQSKNTDLAHKFVDLVTGEYGQKVLAKAGFAKP